MKPIAKQLIVAVFVLALVTVASLGIRQIRFSAHRARTVESPIVAGTEPEPLPAESDTVDAEPELQYTDVPEPAEEVPSEEYAKAKAKDSGGLQKISMGDGANLYVTEKGGTWYTGKDADGNPTKMQVQIDEATGEITVVGKVYSSKSGGPQKISMGDGYDMYVTEEGQTWYVGGGSKSRVEIDDSTGEITVLEQYGDGDK